MTEKAQNPHAQFFKEIVSQPESITDLGEDLIDFKTETNLRNWLKENI